MSEHITNLGNQCVLTGNQLPNLTVYTFGASKDDVYFIRYKIRIPQSVFPSDGVLRAFNFALTYECTDDGQSGGSARIEAFLTQENQNICGTNNVDRYCLKSTTNTAILQDVNNTVGYKNRLADNSAQSKFLAKDERANPPQISQFTAYNSLLDGSGYHQLLIRIDLLNNQSIQPDTTYDLVLFRRISGTTKNRVKTYAYRGNNINAAWILNLYTYDKPNIISDVTTSTKYVAYNSNNSYTKVTLNWQVNDLTIPKTGTTLDGYKIGLDINGYDDVIVSGGMGSTGTHTYTFQLDTSNISSFTQGKDIQFYVYAYCSDNTLDSEYSNCSTKVKVNRLPAVPSTNSSTHIENSIPVIYINKTSGIRLENFDLTKGTAGTSETDQLTSIYYTFSNSANGAIKLESMPNIIELTGFNLVSGTPNYYRKNIYFWTWDGYNYSANSLSGYIQYENLTDDSHTITFTPNSSGSEIITYNYDSQDLTYYSILQPSVTNNTRNLKANLNYIYSYEINNNGIKNIISLENGLLKLYKIWTRNSSNSYKIYAKIQQKYNNIVIDDTDWFPCKNNSTDIVFNYPLGPVGTNLINQWGNTNLGQQNRIYQKVRCKFKKETSIKEVQVYISEPNNTKDAADNATPSKNIATSTITNDYFDVLINNLEEWKWYRIQFRFTSVFKDGTKITNVSQYELTRQVTGNVMNNNSGAGINFTISDGSSIIYPFRKDNGYITYNLGGLMAPENYDINSNWKIKLYANNTYYDPNFNWEDSESESYKIANLSKNFFFNSPIASRPFGIEGQQKEGYWDYSALNKNYTIGYYLYYTNVVSNISYNEPLYHISTSRDLVTTGLNFIDNFSASEDEFILSDTPLEDDQRRPQLQEDYWIQGNTTITTHNANVYSVQPYYQTSNDTEIWSNRINYGQEIIAQTEEPSSRAENDEITYNIEVSSDDYTIPEVKEYKYIRFGIYIKSATDKNINSFIDVLDNPNSLSQNSRFFGLRQFLAPKILNFSNINFISAENKFVIKYRMKNYGKLHSNDITSQGNYKKQEGGSGSGSNLTLQRSTNALFESYDTIFTSYDANIFDESQDQSYYDDTISEITNWTVLYYRFVYTVYSKNGNLEKQYFSDLQSIQNKAPTISYRKNRIGINYSDFTSLTTPSGYENAALILNEANQNYMVYLTSPGSAQYQPHTIAINLRTGDITGINGGGSTASIDCGDWDEPLPGYLVIDCGIWGGEN